MEVQKYIGMSRSIIGVFDYPRKKVKQKFLS